tara:strand:+ start:64 stop:519 length:456 start_codon:yes stop_codon:yes gene_type:complete
MSSIKHKGAAETLMGAVVLITALIFVIYSFQKTEISRELSDDKLIIFADFESADGLRVGSDVTLAGVKIGTVSEIRLNKEYFYARASMNLSDDFLIPNDTEAIIVSDGLLGDKYISLNVGGSDVPLKAGDQIVYTQGSINIVNLLNKFSGK